MTKAQEYRVKEEFKPLCCPNVFKIGDTLTILRQTSKNRLSVSCKEHNNGCHNVKRSTFNRCCSLGVDYERSLQDYSDALEAHIEAQG